MRGFLLACLVTLLLFATLGIQAADPIVPQLTETQLWRLKAHVLAFQLAQAQLDGVLKDYARLGFDLDPLTGTYRPKPDAPPTVTP